MGRVDVVDEVDAVDVGEGRAQGAGPLGDAAAVRGGAALPLRRPGPREVVVPLAEGERVGDVGGVAVDGGALDLGARGARGPPRRGARVGRAFEIQKNETVGGRRGRTRRNHSLTPPSRVSTAWEATPRRPLAAGDQ